MKRLLVFVVFAIASTAGIAQNRPPVKFGKIDPKDFIVTSPVVDSGDAAIVLSDIASTDFEGNNNGDFSLVFKHHKRVLIRKKTAFDDATIAIQLYAPGATVETEKLSDLQAATYYLQGNEIIEKKLDKNSVLTEKMNSLISVRKFTFPDLREGCIIDYSYTIKSPYYQRLRAWTFQEEYPVLWSEYKVTIPFMFDYIRASTGYLPYSKDSSYREFRNYTINIPSNNAYMRSDLISLSGDAVTNIWVMQDVPPFKVEPYMSTAENHISRVKFQLRSITYSENNTKYIIKDWITTANDLMKDENFAKSIYEVNGWLDDEMKKHIMKDDELETAKRIYAYVRDNFVCSDRDNMWLSQLLKKTYSSKTGNVADINMLLTAMLRKAGIQAVPVMLSTRDNGKANEEAALLTQYNYLISRIELQGITYLLDATETNAGFGQINVHCYNGSGRIIDQFPSLIQLDPDSISDVNIISVQILNDEAGNMKGDYYQLAGKFSSMAMRTLFANKKQDELIKLITKDFPSGYSFSELVIDSLALKNFPVSLNYKMKFKMSQEDDDIIYFNPMADAGHIKNPFASAERLYPVEMPYCVNETYVLTIEVPNGYRIEELPKSTRVHFNEGDGMFEYIINKQDNKISLRSKLFFKKANFPPEDYDVLRQFYGFIVKKHAEQIVFKKN